MIAKIKNSTFYVVATPIGNLQDITYRALEVLKGVDVILAEDTRVTARLLKSLNIRLEQKLISCHDFNEEQRVEQVKELLDDEQSVALVSDAGTPLISDPGYKIVSSLRKEGYKIEAIPGVSAVITALSIAGLPSDSFTFKGFLSAKKSKRQQQLTEFKGYNSTVILYESVHRIEYLLDDLVEILANYNIVVAKELTKKFEEVVSGKPCVVKQYFVDNSDKVKGEFVVLIDCNGDNNISSSEINEDLLLEKLMQELPLKKAVKITTELLKLKKNAVYEKALELKDKIEL